ncbi:hypothetical protein BHM03_00057362 [Ensete ventricosum]|nr:hypothetical protein BHM03_00057362 [Ensete ventricosum]
MEPCKNWRPGRSSPANGAKVWIVLGITVAGVIILAEATRRRRRRSRGVPRRVEFFGAFVERFELAPSPQPPPPAARHPLADLKFAVSDKSVAFPICLPRSSPSSVSQQI